MQAAVHWVTERAGGGLLKPNDLLQPESDTTVLDVLRGKHPDPSLPPVSIFASMDNLPIWKKLNCK